jgi:hypothetical protein
VTAPAPHVTAPRADLPVFASERRRRARALRFAGWTLAAVTALWLVALVLGAFGLRPLPALGLPQAPGAAASPAHDRTAGASATGAIARVRHVTTAARATQAARHGGSANSSHTAGGSRKDPGGSSASSGGASTGGSGPTKGTPSVSPPSTGPSASATPGSKAHVNNGNSATAPGAANRPDRTAGTTPGKSGSAPGAAVSGGHRGANGRGPKSP